MKFWEREREQETGIKSRLQFGPTTNPTASQRQIHIATTAQRQVGPDVALMTDSESSDWSLACPLWPTDPSWPSPSTSQSSPLLS